VRDVTDQVRTEAELVGMLSEAVVPLGPNRRRPPLFCVHPGLGFGFCYAGLVRSLGPVCSLYAIQARSLTRPEPAPASVEAMAADYLELVRATAPDGPYCLLGWSFGGLVAHALAVELERRGEQVPLLALMDSHPYRDRVRAARGVDEQEALTRLLEDLRFDLESEPRPVSRDRFFELVFKRIPSLALLDEERRANLVATWITSLRLARSHVPAHFGGDLVFFSAAAEAHRSDPLVTWRPHVGGAIVNHDLDCKHTQMSDPANLARIGQVVASAVARLQPD
jgi:thioesterase domain-containing protein